MGRLSLYRTFASSFWKVRWLRGACISAWSAACDAATSYTGSVFVTGSRERPRRLAISSRRLRLPSSTRLAARWALPVFSSASAISASPPFRSACRLALARTCRSRISCSLRESCLRLDFLHLTSSVPLRRSTFFRLCAIRDDFFPGFGIAGRRSDAVES